MNYALSAVDQALVAATCERVTPDGRPGIIAIHERMIGRDQARRAELAAELAALDRAIALRQASVAMLRAAASGMRPR